MREILFKAKRLDNGEWVEGYLSAPNTISFSPFGGRFFSEVSINTNTICEFTGLTDSKGKKVFEWDILNFWVDNEYTKWSGYIEFGNPNRNYSWGWQIVRMSGDRLNTDTLLWFDMEESGAYNKVIGNIHDKEEPNNEN